MTSPALTNASLMNRRAAVVPRGIGNAHPVFTDHAENAELWDVEGKRYIDFCAGIAVVNTGHNHPEIVGAVSRQLEKFSHTCFQVAAYECYVALAERLAQLAPGSAPKKAMFMTTGAEANENAVKIARAYTGRAGIIAFNGAFHGRTMFALAMTGKVVPYKTGFGPLPADVYHAPYPSAYHGVSVDDAIEGIEKLFKNDVDPQRIGAIFVEPVQGEGGYVPGTAEFFQRLRALCDTHGILLVADEIQTGIGRTGKLFAMEHFGVTPDLITLAKGLGGGMPISAVVGRADIMDAIPPGGLGSTYAGHPLACASALAVLDVIEKEGLCQRSIAIGESLRASFRDMAGSLKCIGDVRGLGAMTAIELVDPVTGAPSADLANKLKAEAFNRGLLLLTCGSYGNVIRVMVPLTIPDSVLREGVAIIETVLHDLMAKG
ncbi:MAG TPA: 4-aminobutyrate--2-oxoglutarate transaminase [Aromatoleum sp.]|uniref:4-aminobutyrate--2-oxoglutarate transaminase n=1 Tax=Aromatoleum sp. TaxID=2307007 RepID=UPI002B482B8B|nr:4-aminobutyrate--2-oxoglutarate transaminase [Aromatoleum sp.]HJV25157.1 4-aminobutyrate--2-oxoglutarate transaminase [Aromatoleum sp.]